MPVIIPWYTQFIFFFIFGAFLVPFMNMMLDKKCEYYEVVVSAIIIFGGFFLHAYLWAIPKQVLVSEFGFFAHWIGGFLGMFFCETLYYSHHEYLRDEYLEEKTILSVNNWKRGII